jgi:hypothetical protein
MNILLALALVSGLDVYFLKDSPNLVVRIFPDIKTEYITIYYSFSGTNWDSTVVEEQGQFFDAVLKSPDTVNVVGVYFMYDNDKVDDNNGALYLYEINIFPRLLMPFSIDDLETMIAQARKKIVSRVHVDEGITLLDYIERMLKVIPVIEGSSNQVKRDILSVDVKELRDQVAK